MPRWKEKGQWTNSGWAALRACQRLLGGLPAVGWGWILGRSLPSCPFAALSAGGRRGQPELAARGVVNSSGSKRVFIAASVEVKSSYEVYYLRLRRTLRSREMEVLGKVTPGVHSRDSVGGSQPFTWMLQGQATREHSSPNLAGTSAPFSIRSVVLIGFTAALPSLLWELVIQQCLQGGSLHVSFSSLTPQICLVLGNVKSHLKIQAHVKSECQSLSL